MDADRRDFPILIRADRYLLLVTETGYAKRVAVDDIPLTKRGREGVRVSSAPLAAAVVVTAADDVVIASRAGMIERVAAADVPVMDRRARGVRVIALGPGDSAAKVALIPETPPGLHPGVACRAASSELDVSPPVALNARGVRVMVSDWLRAQADPWAALETRHGGT